MKADLDSAWSGLPHVWGKPRLQARIRVRPDDFQVMELLGFEPEGQGEHLYLRIRKTGWNTADVSAWLAASLGIPRRDVAHTGLKDRRAVTEQWFAIHAPGPHVPMPPMPEGLELLRTVRHRRKLRIGALAGNRFLIRLRAVRGDRRELGRRLLRICRYGVPNWFGPQRFGREGGNLVAALRLFQGERIQDRHQRGLYLSAARGFLFNRVLARRVSRGDWNRVIDGDLLTFSNSHSLFPAVRLEPQDPRFSDLDLHVTGPLPGIDGMLPEGDALAVERDVLSIYGAFTQGLVDYRLRADRRPLRLTVNDLAWTETHDAIELAFSLPAGAYATAVLREIADCREG